MKAPKLTRADKQVAEMAQFCHRQKMANGEGWNYWQQESETGGDDGLGLE